MEFFLASIPETVRYAAFENNAVARPAVAGFFAQNLVTDFPFHDGDAFILSEVGVKTGASHWFAKTFKVEFAAFYAEEVDFFAVFGFDTERKLVLHDFEFQKVSC